MKKRYFWVVLKSAKDGNSKGQFKVGICYHESIGTTQDEKKAVERYLESAEGWQFE